MIYFRPVLLESTAMIQRRYASFPKTRTTDLTDSRIYYFEYCAAGFATKTLGDVIITAGREGAMELMEGIPL